LRRKREGKKVGLGHWERLNLGGEQLIGLGDQDSILKRKARVIWAVLGLRRIYKDPYSWVS